MRLWWISCSKSGIWVGCFGYHLAKGVFIKVVRHNLTGGEACVCCLGSLTIRGSGGIKSHVEHLIGTAFLMLSVTLWSALRRQCLIARKRSSLSVYYVWMIWNLNMISLRIIIWSENIKFNHLLSFSSFVCWGLFPLLLWVENHRVFLIEPLAHGSHWEFSCRDGGAGDDFYRRETL